MEQRERRRFNKMAHEALRDRFGDGVFLLAPQVRERLLLAEAAQLVWSQVDDARYGAAHTIFRAVMNPDAD